MTRPEDDISAEANIIRDELRHAVKRFDAAASAVVSALDRAERFVRDRRGAHTGPVTTIATPPEQTVTTPHPGADYFTLRE